MIRNLLITASSSLNQTQRNESIQILNTEFSLKPELFLEQIFSLIISQDKFDHIRAFSYLKKVIKDNQKQKMFDISHYFQKAYTYLYEKNMNRNTFDEIMVLERQNLILLFALFLSLPNSRRYREEIMDVMAFKVCELYTKKNKKDLLMYLSFYGEVLKQLVRYRIGTITSRKSAMGCVMLKKITTQLDLQDSLQASLWLNFAINFSKFNSWLPDKGFLIKCFLQFKLSKSSLMSLLQYLSTNFKIIWTLEDFCKILQGLQRIMQDCQNHIINYECKDVETILKCMRSFLHYFFVCQKNIQNSGEALIVEYIYSYQNFAKISNFMINMIEYYSFNNQNETMGNLTQLIVENSTQILRLYSNYLQEEKIEAYSKRFVESFGTDIKSEKVFIFFSALPKFVLEMFNYEQGVLQILNMTIQLQQKYQPVYIGFLTYFVTLNEYLDIEILNKLARFFFNLISSRSEDLKNFMNLGFQRQFPEDAIKVIERMSLAIYGLSKLSKFNNFVQQNPDYFITVVNKIFQLMFFSANDFSILVDSIYQFIKLQKSDWNHYICTVALNNLKTLNYDNLKDKRIIFYQIQIELYRISKKTFNAFNYFQSCLNFYQTQGINGCFKVTQWTQLNTVVACCNLELKSESVKEQILLLIEEILIQFNKINNQGTFKAIQPLLIDFSENIISNILFEEIYRILVETTQLSPENFVQNNMFQKVQLTNEQYAIISSGSLSKQLHLTCVKILLELSLYEKYLQNIFLIISKLNSRYLSCVWEAIQTIYPGKIDSFLIPENVKQRLQKIRNGNLLDLFENMDLNEQSKLKIKQTPSWYQLYRNILRQDSIVIDIIHAKLKNI